MSRVVNIIVWLMLIIGISGLMLLNISANDTFFFSYKTLTELYLFGFTSFLILKRVFFYRIKGNVDVIRLVKKSSVQSSLLWQGLVLALIYVAFNRYYYGNLTHFNTVMITILLLYYIVQLILNSNPSIYIDEAHFSYDDYFVKRWAWQDIQRIELENQKMRLVTDQDSFELDFDIIDEIDYVKLNDEIDYNILDGDFASEDRSKTLVEIVQAYANLYNVRLINSTNRVI